LGGEGEGRGGTNVALFLLVTFYFSLVCLAEELDSGDYAFEGSEVEF